MAGLGRRSTYTAKDRYIPSGRGLVLFVPGGPCPPIRKTDCRMRQAKGPLFQGQEYGQWCLSANVREAKGREGRLYPLSIGGGDREAGPLPLLLVGIQAGVTDGKTCAIEELLGVLKEFKTLDGMGLLS